MIDVNEQKKIVDETNNKEKQYRKCLEIIKQKCWNVVNDKRLCDCFLKRFAENVLEIQEHYQKSIVALVEINYYLNSKRNGSARDLTKIFSELISGTNVTNCAICNEYLVNDLKSEIFNNRRYHTKCYQNEMKEYRKFKDEHQINGKIPTKKSSEVGERVV